MRGILTVILLAGSALLTAQDLGRLPDWASAVARAAEGQAAPADADAWVLLDRTEIAYTGSGEIRQRRFRLVKVLGERGIGQRTFILHGLGGKGNKVKKLKGWNLRPDSELVKLDSDTVVTVNDVTDADFTADTFTGASLDRVVKGSYIAFESLESILNPVGPVAGTRILETYPIRCWELEVAKKEGWFTDLKAVDVKLERNHFTPWITRVESIGTGGIRLSDLPALPKDEGAHPHLSNLLPSVRVRFLDPDFPMGRTWASWDGVAQWMDSRFTQACEPVPVPELQSRKGKEGLLALWAWMGKSMIYKQVYLTPERGWVPEQASEVGRKRYGDCKDLSAFFMGGAKTLGFTVAPALARIAEGEIEPGQEAFPVFNHVISALRLEQSLGWPAEVQTPKGRFLLTDPTDPFTPLGQLGSAHRGRRVMICLPEGAVWVEIPEAAIQVPRLKVDLEGTAQGTTLRATLRLKETGDYWGLRSLAHHGGAKAVRESLMGRRFDLPAHAQIEVIRLGDPLATDQPFEVDVKVTHPEGLLRNGNEWTLVGWGLPYPPSLIQKAGAPRRYPVASTGLGELSYQAVVTVPIAVQPILPTQSTETPFRAFQWRAEARPQEGGSRVELHLEHRYKPATFDFEQRDKGLQAWKQDRNAVKTLREDGLAFKMSGN